MQSKAVWVVVGIVVLAGVAFVGYKLWHKSLQPQAMQPSTSMQATITPLPTAASGLPNKDTSNPQLQQDVQSVQNSMDKLNQDQNISSQDTTTQSQDVPASY